MVTSKTKVTPIRPITLPRLELNGAVLLARLLKVTIHDLQLPDVSITAWTDSMITLQWIQSHPARWKTFVANRVSEIQEHVEPTNWHHVPTLTNPADLASRGIMASDLINNKLWWHGPSWLQQDEHHWPRQEVGKQHCTLEEKPLKTAVFALQKVEILERFSSFPKLVRVIATIRRFCFNCQHKGNKIIGVLNITEIKEATNVILKLVQQKTFQREYDALRTGKQIDQKSKLITLTPFLDQHGVMRVRGRLNNANISYDRKHPIILPDNQFITNLLIDQIHLDTFHGGITLVLNSSRQLYWILNGKKAISRRINNCTVCI